VGIACEAVLWSKVQSSVSTPAPVFDTVSRHDAALMLGATDDNILRWLASGLLQSGQQGGVLRQSIVRMSELLRSFSPSSVLFENEGTPAVDVEEVDPAEYYGL